MSMHWDTWDLYEQQIILAHNNNARRKMSNSYCIITLIQCFLSFKILEMRKQSTCLQGLVMGFGVGERDEYH